MSKLTDLYGDNNNVYQSQIVEQTYQELVSYYAGKPQSNGSHKISCPNPDHPDENPSCDVAIGEKCIVLHCKSRECKDLLRIVANTLSRPLSDFFIENSKNYSSTNSKDIKSISTSSVTVKWENAKDAVDHDYLKNKGIKSYGLKQLGNELIVPMHNTDGNLTSIQTIDSKRKKQKLYAKGISTKNLYYLIGEVRDRIYIAEGYATAASIFECTGQASVVAFSLSQLKNIAILFRKKYPDIEIVICADNDDMNNKSNNGVMAAKNAATIINGKYCVPVSSFPNVKVDFNDVHNNDGADNLIKQLENAISVENNNKKKKRFNIVMYEDFCEPEPLECLINGVIVKNYQTLIFGGWGSGKTFLEVSMLGSIASGTDWFGYEVKDKGLVIIIAGEGHLGMQNRVFAWAKENGISRDEKLLFGVTDSPLLLYQNESIKTLKDEINRISDKYHTQPSLIAVDTLARNFGGEENSNTDMNLYFDTMTDIQYTYNTSILHIHHTGHDNQDRPRGSSALESNIDTSIRVDGEHKHPRNKYYLTGLQMIMRKQKDGHVLEPLHFQTKKVEITEKANSLVLHKCDRSDDIKAVADKLIGNGKNLETYVRVVREFVDSKKREFPNLDPITVEKKHLNDLLEDSGLKRKDTTWLHKKAAEKGLIDDHKAKIFKITLNH